MTEYWVSQGKKWCDFCKIFIANNPLSIRNHDLGQRHKDNVAKRLSATRKEKAAKEKERKDAAQALEQIEAKAKKSYQKDVVAFQEAKDSTELKTDDHMENSEAASHSVLQNDGWEYDASSGYYYTHATGHYYDPSSGLFFSNKIGGKWASKSCTFKFVVGSSNVSIHSEHFVVGKWVTQEEAFASGEISRPSSTGTACSSETGNGNLNASSVSSSSSKTLAPSEPKVTPQSRGGQPPGPIVTMSGRIGLAKDARPSSIAVTKRKREEKPKPQSEEEAAALKAREAARKRTEEREKNLLGLYRSY